MKRTKQKIVWQSEWTPVLRGNCAQYVFVRDKVETPNVVSRAEALRISRNTLEQAEQRRVDAAEGEAVGRE